MDYASDNLKNNKEVVKIAVSKDPYVLSVASTELQNDKEFLLLLKKNKLKDRACQKWYSERMAVLAIYKEQDLLNNSMAQRNEKLPKFKVKKF